MGATTEIQWAHHTFNPWRGCTKVHAGCTNCYAEANYSVKMHGVKWGPNGTRVRLSDAGWKEPLKWNRAAEKAGDRRRVFCASLADVFEDWDGPILDHEGKRLKKAFGNGACDVTLDDLRSRLFELIDSTPWLDWLLLTKRPENVAKMWPIRQDVTYVPEAGALNDWQLNRRENVWLGTSISDQPTAIEWLDRLRHNRSLVPVLFASAEPLLGPIKFCECFVGDNCTPNNTCRNCGRPMLGGGFVDLLIVGGESGPNARPCDVRWIRSLAKQCKAAEVPIFVKQLGSKAFIGDLIHSEDEGNALELNDKKGGDIKEFPEDLRIRQMPSTERIS